MNYTQNKLQKVFNRKVLVISAVGLVVAFAAITAISQTEVLNITKGDGTSLLYVGENPDNVGIGSTSPGYKLHVETDSGPAVYGKNATSGNYGHLGTADYGVIGYGASDGVGVIGSANSANGIGVYGSNPSGYAGYFHRGTNLNCVKVVGNIEVHGSVSKLSGGFKIDHPLDPANKYLNHSFVESPDMMNIYNGNVVLDGNGEAWVELPEWFEALNRDFRYQLTCIGGFVPVYIAEEVSNNQFKIAGGKPGMNVSWQVTGIRQDPHANAHRIQVEEEKP